MAGGGPSDGGDKPKKVPVAAVDACNWPKTGGQKQCKC
jgi:hypothetical protein